MAIIEFGRRRVFILVASIGVLVLLFNVFSLTGVDLSRVSILDLPGRPGSASNTETESQADSEQDDLDTAEPESEAPDSHPISGLRLVADQRWYDYESKISQTFRQTVETYRSKYGRHPPPGFKAWYQFARERNVHNIDDFEQIMDDLRPFWAVEPKIIRQYAAHLWDVQGGSVSGIHIRDHKIAKLNNKGWRAEVLQKVIEKFVDHLPDMDIAMNRLDQPRIVVPWEDMQSLLADESETRAMALHGVVDSFTERQPGLLDIEIEDPKNDSSERLDPEWAGYRTGQFMEVASLSCPPDSPVRTNLSISDTDALYKHPLGGFISNFNRSSDLCTAGPALQDQHGFLFAAISLSVSKKLLPVFGECKVNVNSDILFPANKYYEEDDNFKYAPEHDVAWEDKEDVMLWRGASSGGVQTPDNWRTLHRQRLVQLLNGTHMAVEGKEVTVLGEVTPQFNTSVMNTSYAEFDRFQPSHFAQQHTDASFTTLFNCVPEDCAFLGDELSIQGKVALGFQFVKKYLIDVDGHSFSGRWHAFLESHSLGFKATIFREWHDSRLFAWRHFVPVDNRFDDLYSLLTYFTGYGTPPPQASERDGQINGDVYVPSHDAEGKKIAQQGSEWAKKVLRSEDVEIYVFRLLLEYARIVDDNRDHIGYSGDGSELDRDVDGAEGSWSRWGLEKIFGNTKSPSPA